MRLAIVGAGWAGMAAAVAATQVGHQVTVFEATRTLGGRARALSVTLPDGTAVTVDNGQHILAGAYTETLRLMQLVGVDINQALLRLPLTLRFPDGLGLTLPDWPAPLDAAWGILRARGWHWSDKLSLLRTSGQWRRAGFECGMHESVADVCSGITPRVMTELIEPLCVSALNTPADRSSGQVFLRVMRDALFSKGYAGWAGSNLLLPRQDLGTLFPETASRWLRTHGTQIVLGHRVQALQMQAGGWLVDGQPFDAVLLATPDWEAARLIAGCDVDSGAWVSHAQALQHEAITTVYAYGDVRLTMPVLALRSSPQAPAQFVFDREQLGGPQGLLAFVVSASQGDRQALQDQVMEQARALGWTGLQPVQTVVEKRATFACTPGLQRPTMEVAPRLWTCGDYVQGPYPATIEGAVRSALAAVAHLKP